MITIRRQVEIKVEKENVALLATIDGGEICDVRWAIGISGPNQIYGSLPSNITNIEILEFLLVDFHEALLRGVAETTSTDPR